MLPALYVWHRNLLFLNFYWSGMISTTWNNCSLVFPISEYCCLNCVWEPFQSTAIGLSDAYYNLASPTNVKQNLWTLMPSGKAWVSIQSLVLRRCASTSSSGFPANSGSRCNQSNCCTGPWLYWWSWLCRRYIWLCGRCTDATGGAGAAGGGGCAHGPPLAIYIYDLSRNI